MRAIPRAILALAAVTLACGGEITSVLTDTTKTPVVSNVVILAPASSDIIVGTSIALAAAVRDASGQDIGGLPVVWSSSDPAVATVSATGILAAIEVGSTTITGTVGAKSASILINVRPVPAASVQVTVTSPLIVGQGTEAAVLVRDAGGAILTGRPVAWASSNQAVATISATGGVTAVAPGTTNIAAVVDGVQGLAALTVVPPPVAIASITVSLSAPTVFTPSGTATATAVARDASGNVLSGRQMFWSSSNPAVATVSPTGAVQGIAAGTTTITAASEGKSGSALFTVTLILPVASVTVSAPTLTTTPARTIQASAVVVDQNAVTVTDRVVTWSSGSPAIATVSSTGLITGVAVGSATITAASEGKSGSITVTIVQPPVTTVTVSAPVVTLQPAQTTQATAVVRDNDNLVLTGRVVTWTSTNPVAATVSASGLVTAVATGSTTIRATSEGIVGAVTITVVPPVASVAVTGAVPALLKTQTVQLNATILDTFGNPVTTIPPVWTSSNTAKATISSTGLVTAVGLGTLANVTFTATAAGVSNSATIAVHGRGPETVAALPNVFLNTAMPAAPSGSGIVRAVHNGDDLQAVLNAAQPGDVIELDAGSTFSGSFRLPNKGTSTAWIVIRPSNHASLPAPGVRMTPAIAASLNLPKIVANSTLPALQSNQSAHHYRIMGIEFATTPSVTFSYGLVALDSPTPQTTLAAVPHNLVLDRLYIHGRAGLPLRRCVTLNAASASVIDSWLSECHEAGQDAQAIAGWNGPGPFKIVNNHLEGSAENVIFGGADPGIPNLVPSDIEIRGNHFYKPPSWKGVYLVKNLLELKSAQRVLVEGNVLDGSWTDGQTGFAVVMWSVNQNGGAPWSTTTDVTIRRNIFRNMGAGMSFAANNGTSTAPARRFTVHDNLMTTINSGMFDGAGRAFQLLGALEDMVIHHNTIIAPTNTAMTFGGSAPLRTTFRDNVTGGGQYGVIGDGTVPGNATVNFYMGTGIFSANVMILSSASAFPANNFYPTTANAIGFVAIGSDFSLSGASIYNNVGTDGLDPGVNWAALLAATAGAVVPNGP